MKVLRGILSESKDYYVDIKEKIKRRLASLPKGSVKERNIHGKIYYYLQERRGKKVIQKYLGKEKPLELMKDIKQRKALKNELKKVNGALKILRKSEGKKRV